MLIIFIFCLTAFHKLSLLYFPLLHFPPLLSTPEFSTPAFSTSAVYSCIFHSCIFHPCCLLLNFPLLHFPLPHFQRPHCDRTKETAAHILKPHERLFILIFWQEKWFIMVLGETPCTWNCQCLQFSECNVHVGPKMNEWKNPHWLLLCCCLCMKWLASTWLCDWQNT